MSARTDMIKFLAEYVKLGIGADLVKRIAKFEAMTDAEYDDAVDVANERAMQLRPDRDEEREDYRSAMRDAGRGHLLR